MGNPAQINETPQDCTRISSGKSLTVARFFIAKDSRFVDNTAALRTPRSLLRFALGFLPGVLFADEPAATSPQPSDDPPPGFINQWLMSQTGLVAHGISISGSEVADAFANVHGGKKTGVAAEGEFTLNLDVDAAKLIGWPNASMRLSVLSPHGSSVSDRYVGDLGDIDSLDAYDSFRLYEAWAEQSTPDGRLSLRLGLLLADSEFCIVDSASTLINSSFGTPAPLTVNFAMATYPYNALGARLKIKPASNCTVMLGVYDGNVAPAVFPDPTPGAAASNEFNHWGTHIAVREDEGAIFFGEIAWKHAGAKDRDGSSQLSGTFKLGGAWSTDRFGTIDARTHDALGIPEEVSSSGYRGNYALYAIADHEVWRKHGTQHGGASVFLRGVYSPPSRNLVSCSVDCGLAIRGVLQSDARDCLAIGAVWLGLSPCIADAYRDAHQRRPRNEWAAEITYQYQLSQACTIQPDIQWVGDPVGSGRDAFVIGLRTTINF